MTENRYLQVVGLAGLLRWPKLIRYFPIERADRLETIGHRSLPFNKVVIQPCVQWSSDDESTGTTVAEFCHTDCCISNWVRFGIGTGRLQFLVCLFLYSCRFDANWRFWTIVQCLLKILW